MAIFLTATDTEPASTTGTMYYDSSEKSLKQYNGTRWEAIQPGAYLASSVGIGTSSWGTCFAMSSLDNGVYLFETSNAESYPYSTGYIVKGTVNSNRENWGYIKAGTYTSHRISSGNFQVYHGITWGGHMSFFYRWHKIKDLP